MANSSLRAPAARDSAGLDAALLILRLVLGVLVLMHGIGKLPPPPAFLIDSLAKAGLPSVIAYGVYLGEIVGPILIIVGVWTRVGALLIVANMAVAVLMAHAGDLFKMNGQGGYELELQAMYLFTAVALALTGAGRFSIGGRYGPLN
ncbi:MAG: DoxX family protein [Caldimonas sp.]